MPWTQTDRSFKTLINRRTTSSGKQYYEEIGDHTLNVHIDEVWAQTLPSDPATAVSQGLASQYTLFTMTEDVSVGSQQCYYAYSGGNRLEDWISDKYGTGYAVNLYQSTGAQIFPTDACQWFFDYPTGILTFNASTAAFSKPFKISGYRYIGTKGGGGGSVPIATDTTAGRVYIAGNNTPTPLVSPTALRTDDSRVPQWNSAGVGTHGFVGDATVARDATVGRSLVVGGLLYPLADGSSGYAIITDGAGHLSFGQSGTQLTGKEIYQVYDVTTAGPTLFPLTYTPLNPDSLRMFPEGGVEFVNRTDFTVAGNSVTYLAGIPSFESGDKIVFKYIKS